MFSSICRCKQLYVNPSIQCGILCLQTKVLYSTKSSCEPKRNIPVGSIVNDATFDNLIRKPHEQQIYHTKFPSNIKVAGIITKNGCIGTSAVIATSFCGCLAFSLLGLISPDFLLSLGDSSYLLNRMFPFLLSVGNDSVRHTAQLLTIISPAWIAGSLGISWLGCKRDIKALYANYEKKNEVIIEDKGPAFVQKCSLEDGCSLRFYGDESGHGNGRLFTKTSSESIYDGYGGDCSYKAKQKQSRVCDEINTKEKINH